MKPRLAFLLDAFYKNTPGVTENEIAAVHEDIGFQLPADYLEVMREFDGGEGKPGGVGRRLILYSLYEAVEANQLMHDLMRQIPDYFLFGRDSSDGGFAFHKQNRTVHEFGLMSNFRTDPIDLVGNSFEEFLEFLYNYY